MQSFFKSFIHISNLFKVNYRAVNMFTSSPLNVNWMFRGEGGKANQFLGVSAGAFFTKSKLSHFSNVGIKLRMVNMTLLFSRLLFSLPNIEVRSKNVNRKKQKYRCCNRTGSIGESINRFLKVSKLCFKSSKLC